MGAENEGAAADTRSGADGTTRALSPREADPLGKTTGPSALQTAGNPASLDPSTSKLLWCGGKVCSEKGGIEIHRADASCRKFHPTRRARHG